MEFMHKWLTRLPALAAVVVMVVGVAACGSDDSGDGGGAQAQQGASPQSGGDSASDATLAASGGTPEEQVRATLAQWMRGLRKPDPKLACSVVNDNVDRQLKIIYDKAKTCEDVIEYVAPKIYPGEPKVLSLKVKGNKADMVIASAKGDRVQSMEFTKQGGTWMISDGFGQRARKVKDTESQ